MKRSIIHFILAVCTLSSFAQQNDGGARLRSLIGEALASNPRLAAFNAATRQAEARVSRQRAWAPPRVTATLMETPATSANPFRDHLERFYQVEQMIPFPGKVGAATQAAEAGVRQSISTRVSLEQWLLAEVKRLYAHLLSTQRRLTINDEQHELLRQMVQSTEGKYTVGRATQADVLRLTIELRKLENERTAIEQERHAAKAQLNALRGKPAADPLEDVPAFDPPLPMIATDTLVSRALHQRPDLLGIDAELAMSRAEQSMAEREYWPDLMIGAGYRNRRVMPDAWEVMLGVSIPIAPWATGKTSGLVEERRAAVQSTELMREELMNMVRFDVVTREQKMLSHWTQAERYRTEIIPKAEQTLGSLRAGYQTNQTDFLSLIDSFRMLQMFKMEYVMQMMEYHMARADLEQAVGSELQ